MRIAPSYPDDLELARAAIRGAGRSEERLFQRLDCVQRFVRDSNRRLGCPLRPDLLEDLAQEVLMRIWSRLHEYRGEAALESWAYSYCCYATRNAARKSWRQTARYESLEAQVDGSGAVGSTPCLDNRPGFDWKRLLGRLSQREAMVIQANILEGRALKAVAEESGLSLSSVSTYKERALTKLRNQWTVLVR